MTEDKPPAGGPSDREIVVSRLLDAPRELVFEAFTRPERLVYDHGSDKDPKQFLVTTTFEDRDGKTLLTLRMVCPTAEACRRVNDHGAVEGGKQTLARLAEYLKSMH